MLGCILNSLIFHVRSLCHSGNVNQLHLSSFYRCILRSEYHGRALRFVLCASLVLVVAINKMPLFNPALPRYYRFIQWQCFVRLSQRQPGYAAYNKCMHVDVLFRGRFVNLASPNFITNHPLHNTQVIQALSLNEWCFMAAYTDGFERTSWCHILIL